MIYSQNGSVYRTVLAGVIGVAFCFALTWPQYAKSRNARHLSQAAEQGRALAFAEESYKQTHGEYTPAFQKLGVPLPCPMVSNGQGLHMDCREYTYYLQPEGILRIAHKTLPVWLLVDIAGGSVECRHPENDWAGEDLCARMQ